MLWRNSRGRPLNAPAAFIHPDYPRIGLSLVCFDVSLADEAEIVQHQINPSLGTRVRYAGGKIARSMSRSCRAEQPARVGNRWKIRGTECNMHDMKVALPA